MYLWRVNTIGTAGDTAGKQIARLIVTDAARGEDAEFRVRQLFGGQLEALKGLDLIGRIPGIAGTSPTSSPSIYYVVASFLQPRDPMNSTTTRRVITDFESRIDKQVASAFTPQFHIGAITVGAGEASDVSRLGVLMALVSGSIDEAVDVLHGQVFGGQVDINEINVLTVQNVSMSFAANGT